MGIFTTVRQNFAASLLALSLLAACAVPQAPSPDQLQTRADSACLCNRTAKNPAAYNDAAPTACWADFDTALKQSQWAYMPVAADGPMSSAGICIAGGSDSCAPQNIVWIERGLGACSAAEAQKRLRSFNACLKTNGGDEIACGNAVR